MLILYVVSTFFINMLILLFFLKLPQLSSSLFPYTTLFRSRGRGGGGKPGAVQLSLCAHDGPRQRGLLRRRGPSRSEEHTSELQSRRDIVCRLLLEKKKNLGIRR